MREPEPEPPTGQDLSSSYLSSSTRSPDGPSGQPADGAEPPEDPSAAARSADAHREPATVPPVASATTSTVDGGGPRQPVRETRGPNEIVLAGVLLAVVVGLALVGQDHWRRGLLLAGIGLLAGAVVRLVLPARVAGLLAVRGRIFDTVVLAVLGTAVVVLTLSVPLPPGSG